MSNFVKGVIVVGFGFAYYAIGGAALHAAINWTNAPYLVPGAVIVFSIIVAKLMDRRAEAQKPQEQPLWRRGSIEHSERPDRLVRPD
jgi:membrane protein implicated in regulation of membrane protease activity